MRSYLLATVLVPLLFSPVQADSCCKSGLAHWFFAILCGPWCDPAAADRAEESDAAVEKVIQGSLNLWRDLWNAGKHKEALALIEKTAALNVKHADVAHALAVSQAVKDAEGMVREKVKGPKLIFIIGSHGAIGGTRLDGSETFNPSRMLGKDVSSDVGAESIHDRTADLYKAAEAQYPTQSFREIPTRNVGFPNCAIRLLEPDQEELLATLFPLFWKMVPNPRLWSFGDIAAPVPHWLDSKYRGDGVSGLVNSKDKADADITSLVGLSQKSIPYNFTPTVEPMRITTPHLRAECQRVMKTDDPDVFILVGNVAVESTAVGAAIVVRSDAVTVNVKSGSVRAINFMSLELFAGSNTEGWIRLYGWWCPY